MTSKKIRIRIIFEGLVTKTTAKSLIEYNKQSKLGKLAKSYSEANNISYGEYDIVPDKPFNITVEVVKKEKKEK